MRIFVTGNDGQVVKCLEEACATSADLSLVKGGRPELDLCDPRAVGDVIARARPDIVINAAAYTAVDQAESDAATAMAVNADGAGAVAAAAAALGVPVIQISTDYVFSGALDRAYQETDATGPASVYGASKLAGEAAVAAANNRHIVLRTAWVYSVYGKNFVKTMLRLAADRDQLGVVADQLGNPTSAHDIADALIAVSRAALLPGFDGWGVYHLAGSGEATWAAFAEQIFAESAALGGKQPAVKGIATSDYPTPAKRPANSRMDCAKLERVFGWRAPQWRQSLKGVVARLSAQT